MSARKPRSTSVVSTSVSHAMPEKLPWTVLGFQTRPMDLGVLGHTDVGQSESVFSADWLRYFLFRSPLQGPLLRPPRLGVGSFSRGTPPSAPSRRSTWSQTSTRPLSEDSTTRAVHVRQIRSIFISFTRGWLFVTSSHRQ